MDLSKFARLAQLDLTREEQAEFSVQIQSVLAHVHSLQAVDTSSVSTRAGGEATPLRDDDGGEDLRVVSRTDLVELSQSSAGHCFEVPQVVG